MPNASVPAAAEGMPKMSRHSLVEAASGASVDPMLAFLAEWEAVRRSGDNVPAEEADHWSETVLAPMDKRVAAGDIPAPTTTEGAAAALREALAAGDMEKMDASFVKAALSFLDGRGVPSADEPARVGPIGGLDLSTEFANVAHLADLANWLLLSSMERGLNPEKGACFRIPEREGSQLGALLVVLSEYAERVIAEADGKAGAA